MKALILVDLQNDFTPTGALPVAEGDQIIPLINQLQSKFDLIVATQDWHPADHESFAKYHDKEPGELIDLHGLQQVLWPVHCVQDTKGAEFISELELNLIDWICRKGNDKSVDSYSGFFDNGHRNKTELDDYLKSKNIREVFIVGLATDYCVKFTALDAIELGYKVNLIEDATKGVNLSADDVDNAIKEMRNMGITILQSSNIL